MSWVPTWERAHELAEGPLEARSELLGTAYDLIAAYRPFETPARSFFFERSGLGMAGVGGLAVPVPGGPGRFERAAGEVLRALASFPSPEEAPGPVVAGGLPFDEHVDGMLQVLTWSVVRREPGETWRVEILPSGAAPRAGDPAPRGRAVGGTPRSVYEEGRVRPEPPPGDYTAAVEEAIDRIGEGEFRKVVLARSLVLDAGSELDVRPLLWRLRAVDPDCFTFAAATLRGTLVGATPELLVSRSGRDVQARPLAGSAPRFGDPAADQASGEGLLASTKDNEEHELVAEAVEEVLAPLCEELSRDDRPVLRGTANVWHLATRFRGRLLEPAPSVLELVGALHPTPAVCGTPRDAARRAISELEPFDRGCYAGPVGWMDSNGNGEWALALRCAELHGREARLFAGAGIVAGSDPARELEETERKFRALLDSLRWG